MASVSASLRRCFSLTPSTMMRWCSILLIQELCLIAFMVAGTHGLIVHLDHSATTDWVSFYAAGHLADAGMPQLAYDQAAHFAAERQATQPGIEYVFFYYPPPFLLLCAVFARLPYVASFVAFQAMSLGLYLLAARRILRARGWHWMVPLLAFPAGTVAVGYGQNSFLTAALFAGATVLLDRRGILAGVLFGLLCYKPHFGLLVPLVLVAGGYWHSFAAATATVLTLFAGSLAAFGWATWTAFFRAFVSSHAMYQAGTVPFHLFVTPFGSARLMSAPIAAAYGIQLAVSLVVAGLTAWIWRRDPRIAIRAASLIAGTLLVVPLALDYDLVMLTVAVAWLARDFATEGMPGWERLALVGVYLGSFVVIASQLPLPLGPIPAGLVLAICVSRSLRQRPLGSASPATERHRPRMLQHWRLAKA